MDPDGKRLWPRAGPKLPSGWKEALSPVSVGPHAGSCGAAAFRKERVVVSDIATDPLFARHRPLALGYRLHAAWSQPLLSKDGEVLGTFAMYYDTPREPTDSDLRLIEGAGHLAVIAIEAERARAALHEAFEKVERSEAQLRRIIDAIPIQAWSLRPDGTVRYRNSSPDPVVM